MMADFEAKMKQLEQSTLAQLRRRYAEVFGEQPLVTNNKSWLVKRVAWRLQALAEGDLSERARQRAAELARDADLRILPPRSSGDGFAARLSTRSHDSRRSGLAEGTVLQRSYKGRMLEVKVLTVGFEYQGRRYASLSAVAKDITGSHCSGVRFFGLAKQGGHA